jgi:hypothetical protein
MKFPVDFDIFSPFNIRYPLHWYDLVQVSSYFSGQMAAWWYRLIVRWFLMRSFAEHLMFIGYQYLNSFLRGASFSSDT